MEPKSEAVTEERKIGIAAIMLQQIIISSELGRSVLHPSCVVLY